MIQKNRHRGRVLRVKTGYNPNSSSVGSLIPAFLAFAAGAGAITVIAMNTLNAASKRMRKRKENMHFDTEK